jgi:CheY-like chemotaxis protein
MQRLVLLVEDSETTVLVMQMQLELLGYRVTIARNGAEAVAKAAAELPDIIVMDMQMPVMSGMEAAARIRQDPKTKSIPILAATAKAMSGDREKCIASGCDAYLTKPFTHRVLGAEIQKLLNDSP